MDDILQREPEFRYRLLDRMQQDCRYYLGNGNRYNKHLWAGDEHQQIEIMIKLHDSFDSDKKPEWLTMPEIMEYRNQMIGAK